MKTYPVNILKWFGLFLDGELWYVFHSREAADERMKEIMTAGKKEIKAVNITYYI